MHPVNQRQHEIRSTRSNVSRLAKRLACSWLRAVAGTCPAGQSRGPIRRRGRKRQDSPHVGETGRDPRSPFFFGFPHLARGRQLQQARPFYLCPCASPQTLPRPIAWGTLGLWLMMIRARIEPEWAIKCMTFPCRVALVHFIIGLAARAVCKLSFAWCG